MGYPIENESEKLIVRFDGIQRVNPAVPPPHNGTYYLDPIYPGTLYRKTIDGQIFEYSFYYWSPELWQARLSIGFGSYKWEFLRGNYPWDEGSIISFENFGPVGDDPYGWGTGTVLAPIGLLTLPSQKQIAQELGIPNIEKTYSEPQPADANSAGLRMASHYCGTCAYIKYKQQEI